jgi:hypothetical protein
MEDDNLDEIVDGIFSVPPGPPGSVQLELEDETSRIAEESGVSQFIFNILFLITYKGMQKLFNKDSFLNLSYIEFQKLQSYLRSCGYEFKVYGNNTRLTPWELIQNNILVEQFNIEFEYVYGS